MTITPYLVIFGQVLNLAVIGGEQLDIMELAVLVHLERQELDVDNLVRLGCDNMPRAF